MKTRIVSFIFILSLVFLFGGNVMAQQTEAEEIFNEKFEELNNELKFNPSIKDLSPKAVADYRNVLKKLDDAIDDLVAFEVGALTDENTKVFEYKRLRKAKDLTGLRPLIIEQKHKIREYMGDKTDFGADSLECIKNIALLQQTTKNGNWAAAYPHWNALFHYYPRASRTTYSKGTDIVEFKYNKEKDAVTKDKWIDTLMMLYDQRIKFFGDSKKYPKGYILGRKAVDLLKFRQTAFEQAYKIFDESVKLQGVDSEDAVLLTFMQATDGMFRADKIDAAILVDNYSRISEILDKRAKLDPKNSVTKTAIDGVDAIFSNSPASTCEALVPAYQKKFDANKEDVELLKKIAGMLDRKECTDSQLFFDVAIQLDKLEPSDVSKYARAADFIKKKEYDVASEYLNEAIKLATEDTMKAKYYFKLAQVTNEMGQKSQARTLALKAATLKSNYGAPYLLIATMYASSGCSQLTSPEGELGNVGFWVAVDKLVKARSIDPSIAEAATALIGRYSGGFPNAEKAFMIGVTKGKTVTVGCWINETTTARF